MSIVGQIKHGVHHATHSVQHAATDASHKVDHAANHAVHEVSNGANEAADAIKEGADKAREGINMLDPSHIAEEIKHDILKALESAEKAAVSAIKDAEKSATTELKKAGDEIKKDIQAEVNKILKTLEGKAAHEILKDLVDVIRALSPDNIAIQLGPVQLAIGNLEEKVEHFVKWAKKPPNNLKTWMSFVQDVTPNELSLVQSIGLGLVVQSDDLKLGITETWGSEKVLDRLEKILKRAGIH